MFKLLVLVLVGLFLVALATPTAAGKKSQDVKKSNLGKEVEGGNNELSSLKKTKKSKNGKKKRTRTIKKKMGKKSAKTSKVSKKAKKLEKRQKKKIKNQKKKKAKKSRRVESQINDKIVKSVRQTCTADEACLTNVSKYMNIVLNKIKNFNQQKARIERFVKLSQSKGDKKAEFLPLLSQLKESGGGNASALVCSGNSSSPATARLNNVVASLTSCQDNIKQACETALPTVNATLLDTCASDAKAFTDAVDICTKKTADICTCWKDPNLETLNTKFTPCNIAQLNADVTKTQKSCVAAFSECRGLQDEASQVITNCAKSPADIKKKIDAATATLQALEKLKIAATAIANQARKTRDIRTIGNRAVTCSVYIKTFETVVNNAGNSPTSSSSSSAVNALAVETVSVSCMTTEKTSLRTLLAILDQIILLVKQLIETLQADYAASTENPTTTAPASTENPTTSAPVTTTTTVTTTKATTKTTSTATTTTTTSNATITTTAAQVKCGVKKAGSKIVGGVETQVNEYPWMVMMAYSDGSYFGCGATLVSAEWVVTAAHCIFSDGPTEDQAVTTSQIFVVLGEHDRISNTETQFRKQFNVEKIITHPGYVIATKKDDIALLKLSTKADLKIYTPACLPAVGTSFVGKTGTVYGWGSTTSGGDNSNKLLEVNQDVVSTNTCKSVFDTQILNGMLCAGGVEGKDSCQGDSGGPFTVPDATTQQHSLAGVVSWGAGCAKAGSYGVYADVAYYNTWLQEQFAANGGITLT